MVVFFVIGLFILKFTTKGMIFHFQSLTILFSMTPSYGVYISQLVRFARVCNNVSDFNERNLFITDKLLHQGFRYHKLVKTFTKFYYRYRDLISKFKTTCKTTHSFRHKPPYFLRKYYPQSQKTSTFPR